MSIVEKTHLIDLQGISKSYDGAEALSNINLYIRKKEFITLLGPSGCGKTTTLRIIGGFESPDEGRVLFEGADITGLPPYKRRVNTVFQKYALFSHLNVYENIAFGLRLKKTPKAEIDAQVKKMLAMVAMPAERYASRKVETLSGGQQQRVAIARALANRPEVLLLDEPLGALDLKLRKEMQMELKNIQQELGITFVYVTHDQEEALTMSDTIVVMRDGLIQQIGTPIDIYNEPDNAFVADFIGESNILPGVMLEDKRVTFEGKEFVCVDGGFGRNRPVDVVIRPEDVRVSPCGEGMLDGIVRSIVFKGVHYEMMIETAGGFHWMVHSTAAQQVGEEVGLSVVPFDIHIMHKDLLDPGGLEEVDEA